MNIIIKLTRMELDILEQILNKEIEGVQDIRYPMAYATVAYMAWIGDSGRIDFGPCRWGYRGNVITSEGRKDSWSVSPFSGGWTTVTIDQIVRVCHGEAML